MEFLKKDDEFLRKAVCRSGLGNASAQVVLEKENAAVGVSVRRAESRSRMRCAVRGYGGGGKEEKKLNCIRGAREISARFWPFAFGFLLFSFLFTFGLSRQDPVCASPFSFLKRKGMRRVSGDKASFNPQVTEFDEGLGEVLAKSWRWSLDGLGNERVAGQMYPLAAEYLSGWVRPVVDSPLIGASRQVSFARLIRPRR